MRNELSYEDAVEKAHHLLAIGQTEVYLWKPVAAPWEYVTDVQRGGSHRIEIATDVWLYAQHPCGLTFRWSFDIEPSTANGNGYYQIDVKGCREVLRKLPEAKRHLFADYLKDCAAKVRAKAEEWQSRADKQVSDAMALERATQPWATPQQQEAPRDQ